MNWKQDDDTTHRYTFQKVEVRAKLYYDSGWYTTICYDGHLMWYAYYTKLSSAKRGAKRALKGILRDIFCTIYPTLESMKG